MEFYIGIILVVIFIETTILVLKNTGRTIGRGGKRKVFVDTSSLIDGRVLAVAQTGYIGDELVVPKSVLSELQLLADGSDSDKRSRARFGLDVVAELQKVSGLTVTIMRDDPFVSEGVDNRLITLAKKYGGLIMTNDFNLNKVAVVEGITVLNINDLARGLRSEVLPGETLKLELKQKGSEAGQAVGYLGDGTMVVVEDAASSVGQTVEVEFIRYLQTSAGKMMFAKLHGKQAAKPRQATSVPRQRQEGERKRQGQRGNRGDGQDKKSTENSQPKPKTARRPRRKETGEERLVRLANSGEKKAPRN
ncbi:MAG: hypothetical protein LBG75_02960 [Candidatus Nomurabacteria bacterium]|jgi:uncharacterized protein YacL|nr:hypothetical protein [Candidatus Nomurabacteria bacterium]